MERGQRIEAAADLDRTRVPAARLELLVGWTGRRHGNDAVASRHCRRRQHATARPGAGAAAASAHACRLDKSAVRRAIAASMLPDAPPTFFDTLRLVPR